MIPALVALALVFLGAPPPPSKAKVEQVTRAERVARCTEDTDCSYFGSCTPNPTPGALPVCVVGSDRDCALECIRGACHYDRKSRSCVIKGPSSCANGSACRIQGLCTYVRESENPSERYPSYYDPHCIATDESCARSVNCLLDGKCHADDAGNCEVMSDDDCRRSRRCELFGACARVTGPKGEVWCSAAKEFTSTDAALQDRMCVRYGICGKDTGEAGCRDSEACRVLGWCEAQPSPTPRPDWERTVCIATACAESEVCRLHGACTVVDGFCVVRPPVEPKCTRKRVLGVKATASSMRPPEAKVRFDAAHVADRDTRTAWVPAPGEARSATLTLTLPRPERVVRVSILAGSDMRDWYTDWWVHFTWLMAVKVTVGEVHELGYSLRRWWTPGDKIQVLVPPTQTDTITIQLLMNTMTLIEDAPAIPEIFIEACAEP